MVKRSMNRPLFGEIFDHLFRHSKHMLKTSCNYSYSRAIRLKVSTQKPINFLFKGSEQVNLK